MLAYLVGVGLELIFPPHTFIQSAPDIAVAKVVILAVGAVIAASTHAARHLAICKIACRLFRPLKEVSCDADVVAIPELVTLSHSSSMH